MQQLVEAFLTTVVIVPSGKDLSSAPDSFAPVLVPIDSEQYVVVFGSPEGAATVAHLAPYAVTMLGSDLVARTRSGLGILASIHESGFNLSPQLLDAIRRTNETSNES